MDPISGIDPALTSPTGLGVAQVSADDFFRFISAQLNNQDPLEPVDESQFMGQIAQYAQLDESIKTNNNLQTLALLNDRIAGLQQMTDGAALIGHHIEYSDPETGEPMTGKVDGVRLEEGIVMLTLSDDKQIPLSRMTGITQGSEEDDS